mmetsp:Transcript_22549/g.64050  ORF Transcript_22549/g.64050 Transcript_22549/m.64050 type:complete len:273 (+) Transcript_22549:325-1143(+)
MGVAADSRHVPVHGIHSRLGRQQRLLEQAQALHGVRAAEVEALAALHLCDLGLERGARGRVDHALQVALADDGLGLWAVSGVDRLENVAAEIDTAVVLVHPDRDLAGLPVGAVAHVHGPPFGLLLWHQGRVPVDKDVARVVLKLVEDGGPLPRKHLGHAVRLGSDDHHVEPLTTNLLGGAERRRGAVHLDVSARKEGVLQSPAGRVDAHGRVGPPEKIAEDDFEEIRDELQRVVVHHDVVAREDPAEVPPHPDLVEGGLRLSDALGEPAQGL